MIRQADIGASKAIQVMLVENCQRTDLNPVEKAVALGQLRDFGLTTVRIAKAVGISDATVSTYLLLLELDKRTQDRVRRGELPMMTAVTAVRKTRKLDRARRGEADRGAAVSRTWEPDHLAPSHPLARKAAALCDAREHTMRRRHGGACGLLGAGYPG